MTSACLMQFSGSMSQRVLQPNRIHDNHPIGGVRATPLLSDSVGLVFSWTTTKTKAKMRPDEKRLAFILLMTSEATVKRLCVDKWRRRDSWRHADALLADLRRWPNDWFRWHQQVSLLFEFSAGLLYPMRNFKSYNIYRDRSAYVVVFLRGTCDCLRIH